MSSRISISGIVAAVFDPPAGVRRGGAVAAKQLADLAVIQAQHNMREIHRALPGESDLRTAARARAQFIRRHAEDHGGCLLQQPAQIGGTRRRLRSAPGIGVGFEKGHVAILFIGLFAYMIAEIRAAGISFLSATISLDYLSYLSNPEETVGKLSTAIRNFYTGIYA